MDSSLQGSTRSSKSSSKRRAGGADEDEVNRPSRSRRSAREEETKVPTTARDDQHGDMRKDVTPSRSMRGARGASKSSMTVSRSDPLMMAHPSIAPSTTTAGAQQQTELIAQANIGAQPGAIAVGGGSRRGHQQYRHSTRDDDISTIGGDGPSEANTGARPAPQAQESGFLSTLTPDSPPLLATLVNNNGDDTTMTHDFKTSDMSFCELIRDKRLVVLILLFLLIIVGLAVGVAIAATSSSSSNTKSATAPPDDVPVDAITLRPSLSPSMPPVASVEDFILSVTPNPGALGVPNSPQRMAIETLPADAIRVYGEERVMQMYACNVLRFIILRDANVDIVTGPTATERDEFTRRKTRRAVEKEEYEENEKWLGVDSTKRNKYHSQDTTSTSTASNQASLRLRDIIPRQLQDARDECSWRYMLCNNNQQVTSIQLEPYGHLPMTLPDELSLLFYLVIFNINSNKASGTIPSALATLPNLVTLILSGNDLTGTLPTEFADMPRLEDLGLGWNQLRGTIPSEFGQSTALHKFDVYANRMTGTIPTELFANRDLCYVFIGLNSFRGTIPTEVGSFRILKSIYAEENSLTGTLPTEIGDINDLAQLRLNKNQLVGTIPEEWSNLSDMRDFRLDNNVLTGTIPVGLSLFTLLWGNMGLSHNQFSGTIPTELGRLRGASNLALGNNKLVGTIPTQLGYMTTIGESDG